MDAIIFAHHLPLNVGVTRRHLALIRSLNRDCDVIPLKFAEGRESPHWQWANCDLMLLEWFDQNQPKHNRFYFIEADTFCTMPLKEFYGSAYDRPAVGSVIVKPWSDDLIEGTREPQRMRDFEWFKGNTSGELYPYLRAFTPSCGAMFSHDALFNMVQIWKTVRGFERLFSEVRLGTLACMAGYEPAQIRPDCAKFISPRGVDIDQGPGIYHSVKT